MSSTRAYFAAHGICRAIATSISLALLISCEELTGADFDELAKPPAAGEAGAAGAGHTGGTAGTANGGRNDASVSHADATGATAGIASGNDSSGGNGATGNDADHDDAGGAGADGTDADGDASDGAGSGGNDGGGDVAAARDGSNGLEEGGIDAGNPPQLVVPVTSDNASRFGVSVALKGEWALVGSHERTRDFSFAWFLRRQPNGEWGLKQKLPHPDGSSNTQFGDAVALSEQWAGIGAAGYSSVPGRAFFFRRQSDDTWAPSGHVQSNSPSQYDRFGGSVAIDGSTAVVGAAGEADWRGSVYVYRLGASPVVWQKLEPPSAQSVDNVGVAVAVDGNTLVAGAWGDDTKGESAGAAYVYELSGDNWSLREKLLPTEVAVRGFGGSISLRGDTLVIGALGTAGGGAAYVYTREPGGNFGALLPQLIRPPARLVDLKNFGSVTALCGSRLLIGHEVQSFVVRSVFVYRPNAGVWGLSSELGVGEVYLGFGNQFACDGPTAIVSDISYDSYAGAVYFFDLDR